MQTQLVDKQAINTAQTGDMERWNFLLSYWRHHSGLATFGKNQIQNHADKDNYTE